MSVKFSTNDSQKTTKVTQVKTTVVSSYNKLFGELSQIKRQSQKVINLTQADFKYGTVQIDSDFYVHSLTNNVVKTIMDTSGYVFRLSEDIVFDPMNFSGPVVKATVTTVGKPSPQYGLHTIYPSDKYGIGFFTAIALSARNIVLDLNGFTLSQSLSHRTTQRFYANIETANSPFFMAQGPHSFGTNNVPTRRTMVCNGKIAMSSHHGIHGNQPEGLILKDLDCIDYEVSACSLNGGCDISFVNFRGLGSSPKVDTLGVFSSATFLEPYMSFLKNQPVTMDCFSSVANGIITKTGLQSYNLLVDDIFNVYDFYVNGNGPNGNIIQYVNELKRIDGNSYGISLNQNGATVGPFPKSRTSPATRVYFNNVVLENHIGWVNEVPAAVSLSTLKPMNDSVGAIWQSNQKWRVLHDTGATNKGAFDIDRSIVGFCQFFVSKHQALIPSFLDTSRMSIGPLDVALMESGGSWYQSSYRFNGDSMLHNNKGVIGLKLDAIQDCYANNVTINNTKNITPIFGRFYSDHQYDSDFDSTHAVTDEEFQYKSRLTAELGGSLPGSHSTDCRGISLSSSDSVVLENVRVQNTASERGLATGIDVMFESSNISITGSSQIYQVDASTEATLNEISCKYNPTQLNTGTGIHIANSVKFITLDLEVLDINGLVASDTFKID